LRFIRGLRRGEVKIGEAFGGVEKLLVQAADSFVSERSHDSPFIRSGRPEPVGVKGE
jgi:hypothetical protein